MADLRNIQSPSIRPTTGTDVPQYDNRAITGALAGFGDLRTRMAKEDKSEAELAAATDLGVAAGEIIGSQQAFIVEEAEQKLAREAAEGAEAEGVQNARPVLDDAARLRRANDYLARTGQSATRNQLVTLTKQRELVARRPDLAKDIVNITNSISADVNAIYKTEQDNLNAQLVKERENEETAVREILKANNVYDPTMSWPDQVALAKAEQSYNVGLEEDDRAFKEFEREFTADSLRYGAQERVLGRREMEIKNQAINQLETSYLPHTTLSINAELAQQMGEPDANKRLANAEVLRSKRIANAQATLSRFPDQMNQAIAQINAQYDRAIPRLSGKQEEDSITTANNTAAAAAWAHTLSIDPSIAGDVEVFRKLGPILEVGIGRSAANTLMTDSLLPKLTHAMAGNGMVLDTRSEEAKRTARLNADPAVSSLALLPGQKPKAVTRQQTAKVGQDMRGLLASLSAPDAASRDPKLQALGVQAVLSTLDDPIMQGDSKAQQAVIDQLADPKTVNLFTNNSNSARATASVQQHYNRQEAGIARQLTQRYGRSLDEIAVVNFDPATGAMVFRPILTGINDPALGRVANQITVELNIAAKALAHTQGHKRYAEAAQQLLDFQ